MWDVWGVGRVRCVGVHARAQKGTHWAGRRFMGDGLLGGGGGTPPHPPAPPNRQHRWTTRQGGMECNMCVRAFNSLEIKTAMRWSREVEVVPSMSKDNRVCVIDLRRCGEFVQS